MTSEVWAARYPDLAGKVAIVTGDGRPIVAITRALAANGSLVGVVTFDREIVDAALAEAASVNAMGVVSDPADPATWARVIPHAEQRLGPLDVVIAIGAELARRAAITAVLPDMAARRRGVVIEVSTDGAAEANEQVRRRTIVVDDATSPDDVAAAVALCASDVLGAPVATVRLSP